MGSHHLIQPTFRCQNHCMYCWLNDTIRARPEMMAARERPWQDWVAAINRDKPSVVDLAGGEPLLYAGLAKIIRACPKTMFGLSTNGLELDALRWLCVLQPDNLIGINLSIHPYSDCEAFVRAAECIIAAHGPLRPNVVDYGDNVERAKPVLDWLASKGVPYDISPYEDMAGLADEQPIGLCCKGYLVVAPDGEAWPCLTTLRSPYWKERGLGNWLDGTVNWGKKASPCYLNCIDYFVLPQQHPAGDLWGAAVRPCAS